MSNEAKIIELLKARAIPSDALHRPEAYLSRGARGPRAVTNWTTTIEFPSRFRGREAAVWVAFIDLMADANFEHPVRFVFLAPETGEMEMIDATSPPIDLDTNFQKLDLK